MVEVSSWVAVTSRSPRNALQHNMRFELNDVGIASHLEHTQILEFYRGGDTERTIEISVRHMRTTLSTIAHARDEGLL